MLRWCTALLALGTLLTLGLPLRAQGPNDEVLRGLIGDIFDSEVATKRYDKAIENLEAARGVCEGGACSAEAEAELLVAIGTVQALDGKKAAAKKSFEDALQKDPSAEPDPEHAGATVREVFDQAKGARESAEEQSCKGKFDGSQKKGRGWLNAEAYFCYKQAKEAEDEEDYLRCAEDARHSLSLEKRINTRSVLARCLELGNRWTEAIEQYEQLGREAPRQGQYTVGAKARQRAARLQRQMPSLVLEPPDDVDNLTVKLDGTELPLEVLGAGEIPVNPGKHKVTATGISDGTPVGFSQEILLEADDQITVLLTLTPGEADPQTQRILKCLASGKSPEECLQSTSDSVGGDLSYRIGVEASGYHDDMDVDVATPSASFGVEHVTDGWGVGAAFLVDVVTAASIDILATASPRWREARYVPAINGHKKFGNVDVALRGSLSHEPDYISGSVGTTVTADFAQKTVTPSLGFEYSHDINGKRGTDFDVFSRDINRYALNAGLGLVMDKATFGSFSFTAVIEDGDLSKPYRHIPMFSEQTAPLVPRGLSIQAVNLFREPERPLEQLPTSRKRFALAFSVAHRFSDSTIRGNQRFYVDTWGTKASTTDLRFMYDILKELRIWPHLRFHGQTKADFYELAYVVRRAPDGSSVLPEYRTGDRELGPLTALTGGFGVRYEFGERREMGLMLTGDYIWTEFLEHLFVFRRHGFFGALAFDAELE